MRNKKSQGMSIRMIVIIAIAVFVLFLVIGFVTGGWAYFANLLKGGTTSGSEAASLNCERWCTGWINKGCPSDDAYYDKQVNVICHTDVDFDNDGTNDPYYCKDYDISDTTSGCTNLPAGTLQGPMSGSECGC